MNLTFFLRKHTVNLAYSILDLFPDYELKKNKQFFNLHKDKRCFILGSGHSILKHDLTLLKNEIVFTQNHFNAHKDISIINPTYHVVIPKFHPSEYDQDWIDWINNMEVTLPRSTQFFFGKNTKGLIDSKTKLTDRSYYINTGFHAICLKNPKVDITKRIMNVPTVITQCIIIALYMGFREIYLVGFDLDQICRWNDRNNLRFYGHSQITNNDAENKISDLAIASGRNFFTQWATWQQLILLRKFGEKHNQKIFNATNGGILDVYPRIVYESLF